MRFLASIINEYLARNKSVGPEKVPSIDKIAKEISDG